MTCLVSAAVTARHWKQHGGGCRQQKGTGRRKNAQSENGYRRNRNTGHTSKRRQPIKRRRQWAAFMRGFHPDNKHAPDPVYAQKNNDAYSLLLNALKGGGAV